MGDLRRFVEAQAPVYATALSELKAGRKQTHWMCFVFPQLKALGRSSMAQVYGLHDLTEARSHWAHAVLGPRLKECVIAVLSVPSRTANEIFGSPDDLKFCFAEAPERFYAGRRDSVTLLLTGPGA